MQNSFEPHEIALFSRVMDVACAEIGGCDQEIETYMAHRIFCRAHGGDWDFSALLCVARYVSPMPAPRLGELVH